MPTSASNNPAPRCSLICVGSELLRGKLNTHASTIARRLASLGLSLTEEHTVGDKVEEIANVLQQALTRSRVVLVSGGLGPTFDDLTREAAAQAASRPLRYSAALFRGIARKFRRARLRRMPPANARQAYLLEGAEALPNVNGTAPGQILVFPFGGKEKILILLPGPPRELHPMLDHFVLPALKKRLDLRPHAEAHLHFVGVPESWVDHRLRPLIAREQARSGGEGTQFTILAHLGLVDFDVFVSAPTPSRARRTLRRLVREIRARTGRAFYGMDADYPLEKVVGDHFRQRRATLALAESCTGGMLAARLTDIPGSSDFLVAGWVTYSNQAKARELGVSEELLLKYGAVSRPVALAMAKGARLRAGSDCGFGITGIAGPGGATPQKPVGLVYMALSTRKRAVCRAFRFSGDRDAVRQRAVVSALDLLRHI